MQNDKSVEDDHDNKTFCDTDCRERTSLLYKSTHIDELLQKIYAYYGNRMPTYQCKVMKQETSD